jgi:hypothetical protein
VEWSPYKKVVYGSAKDSNKEYVVKTDNSTFRSWNSEKDSWNQLTLNGLVYEVVPEKMLQINKITDLSLLDKLIGERNMSMDTNYFTNIVHPENSITIPYLSGDIFINNSSAISEMEIQRITKNYYPDLNIYVANVDAAYTLKLIDVIDSQENEL